MASWFIERRSTSRGVRYRVRYRLGGREAAVRYGGSFATMREARLRRDWIAGELAAMRVPDLAALAEPEPAAVLRDVAKRWQASRVDVRDGTALQHKTALARVLPVLGDRTIDSIAPADVAALVAELAGAGKARETIRKSLTALAMILDFAEAPMRGRDERGRAVNAARDRLTVRLPLEEPQEPNPPTAEQIEIVYRLLASKHRLALLFLDWSGARVSALDRTLVGDYDEQRRRVRLRAATTKTRKALWIELHPVLADKIEASLGPREDRDPEARLFASSGADSIRTAIAKACRATGIPLWSPHDLRHRRVSLLHLRGVPWARIGEQVGQKNLAVTANTYTHVMTDENELDYSALLARV